MKVISQNYQNIFSFKLLSQEKAISLIEILIEITLSLMISLIGYQALKSSIFIKGIITKDYLQNFHSLQLKSIANNIRKDIDSHPLKIDPKIFYNGMIQINEKLFPISIDPLKQPTVSSEAISYLELDFANRISVTLNDKLILEGCTSINPTGELTRFIGLDLNGASYFQGESIPISDNCYQFFLKQAPNLILPKRSTPFPFFTKILIPVISEYLIYKDQSDQLRYVSLEGNLVKENQPILEDAPDLKIELLKYERIWQVAFHWSYPKNIVQKKFQTIVTPTITRQAIQNLVLNS